jgi:hypothetical protein
MYIHVSEFLFMQMIKAPILTEILINMNMSIYQKREINRNYDIIYNNVYYITVTLSVK